MWISEFGKPDSPLQYYAICNLVWELSGSFLCEHHCVPNCAANNRCSKAKNDTMWTMEQWGLFFPLCCCLEEKKRSLQNKKNNKNKKNKAGIIVFWGCDFEMLSIQGGDKMMPCTRKWVVCGVARTCTGMQACVHRVHIYPGAHIHGVHEPATPDVMCVSVYVDRDQRWVLEHFRPPALPTAIALTVWDLPLSSLTWHYLSLGACGSQWYTAHTDTQSPSLSTALCLTSCAWLFCSLALCLCMSLCPCAFAPLENDTKTPGTHMIVQLY